jgi:serine/threonine-protein kinase
MMTELFGPDRAQLKTQIPTVAQLAALGVKLPSDLGTASAPTPPPAPSSSVSPGPATVVAKPPPAQPVIPAAGQRKSPVLPLILGGAALLAAAAGGALLAPRLAKPTPAPVPTDGQHADAPTPPKPASDQPPAGPATQTAQPVPAEADAGLPEKQPQKTAMQPKPVKPVERLSGQAIAERVALSRAKLLGCFEQNRAALPSGDGKVTLTFTIVKSGTVSNAAVDSPGGSSGPLSQCIVRQVKAMRFPSHKDNEVTVSLPFLYKVSK